MGAGLNAPYGARCFLTQERRSTRPTSRAGLNAPYGARCFLTDFNSRVDGVLRNVVLMHLMALGAF